MLLLLGFETSFLKFSCCFLLSNKISRFSFGCSVDLSSAPPRPCDFGAESNASFL